MNRGWSGGAPGAYPPAPGERGEVDWGYAGGYPGEGGPGEADDNWLGTILLIGLVFLAVLGVGIWGLAGGPISLVAWLSPAGLLALLAGLGAMFLAVLRRGADPALSRSAAGLLIAAAGLALGTLLPGLHVLGLAVATGGLMVMARQVANAGRGALAWGEERYGRLRWIFLSILVIYLVISGFALPGTLRLTALLVLVWPLATGLGERSAGLASRLGRLFHGPPPVEQPPMELPPDPYERFTPRQRIIAHSIARFFGDTFDPLKWKQPQVTAVFDSPGFTTYVLPVPNTIKVEAVVARESDIARSILHEEAAVAVLPAGRHGGVFIQVKKAQKDRGKLWFDQAVVQGAARLQAAGKMAAIIGSDERNQPVLIDLDDQDSPHLLVIGQSGSGKSYMMHLILAQLLARNSPTELQLAVIDPKSTFGMFYHGVPHLFAPVIEGTDGAVELMRAVYDQLEARRAKFSAVKASNIREYRRITRRAMPLLLFVVDEAASLANAGDKKLEEAYSQYMRKLANMGRSLGIYLMIGVQRPTQANVGDFRDNLTKRIVLLLTSASESAMAFGGEGKDTSATKLGGKGDGFLQSQEGRQRFSGAYLPDKLDPEAEGLHKQGVTVGAIIESIIAQWGGVKDWSKHIDPTKVASTLVAGSSAEAGGGLVILSALAAEHNDQCDDREWLVLLGVRAAMTGAAHPFEVITFSPESLAPFVARAADEKGYSGPPINPDEIQRTLGRMFPERDNRPQRSREWPLNGAIVEGLPGQPEHSLMGRFAASTATPPVGDRRVAEVKRKERKSI
jgi:hypothetical protein